jgi:excisionase family DNA binding protein
MGARYLDSAAAAEYLGFGTGKKATDKVRQLVHRRHVPHFKLGGGKALRFDAKELDTWMRRYRVRATDDEMETAL